MEWTNLLSDVVPVAVVGVLVWFYLRGRFEQIDRRFELVPTRDEMNARFDGVDRRIERLESEVDVLRSDLTQIALAVGARTRPPQTG